MMNVAARRGWRLRMDSVHCEYEQISLRPHEKKLVGNSVESPDREAFIIFCLWLVKEARKQG